MNLHRERLRRITPYALVSVAGLFLLRTAMQIDYQERAGTLGPDFWPKLVIALLLIVCAAEILRILFADNPDAESGILENIAGNAQSDPAETLTEPAASRPGLLIAGMAATLAYVALVATTGFVITTAVYLAAFLTIGGYRKRGTIAALSIGGSLLLMFIFMKLVYVSLPIGSGPFAEVTIFLMKIMGIR